MTIALTPSEYQLIGLTEGGDAGDIRAAIDADPQAVRAWLVQSIRPDRAGGWIVPLGEARHIIGGA